MFVHMLQNVHGVCSRLKARKIKGLYLSVNYVNKLI